MGPYLANCIVHAVDPIWTGRFKIPECWGAHALRTGERSFGPPGFQSELARARLAEYQRVLKTFRIRSVVTNPQFDWAQDPYWPTWFVDALDILGIRTKSAYAFTGPSARFQVTTVYRPCVSVSQSVTHKLVKKKVKGHDEIEDEEDVSTVDAVFSYDGRYFRHLVNPVTGAQLEPLETFIRLPRMSARFIVPPLSAAAAGGAKLTRHYLYNFTVQLRKGCDVGRSVAEFKDYTPWIERTRSRIRSVFDRTAGKFTKLPGWISKRYQS